VLQLQEALSLDRVGFIGLAALQIRQALLQVGESATGCRRRLLAGLRVCAGKGLLEDVQFVLEILNTVAVGKTALTTRRVLDGNFAVEALTAIESIGEQVTSRGMGA